MKPRFSPLYLLVVIPIAVTAGFGQDGADNNWDQVLGSVGVTATSANPNGVRSIAIAGSRVIAGGTFSTVGTVTASNIAQWDGSKWTPLNDGLMRPGFRPSVEVLQPLGASIYVGGIFTRAGSSEMNFIGRWNGTDWESVGLGANGAVYALAASGTNLYAGGNFTVIGGGPAMRIAVWNGISWAAIGAITNGDRYCVDGCIDDGVVYAMAARGNDLYVAGRFNYAGGVFATNIARWDGTNWHALGNGLPNDVWALAVSDSGLYAGGFSFPIRRFDGTNWLALGAGLSNNLTAPTVSALAVVGQDLYAGGSFTSAGGNPAANIAKWNGSEWSSLGSGVGEPGYSVVNALASNGSELFVGGVFTTAGGKPATNIALWHIPHELSSRRTGSQLTLSWPATGSNMVLESCAALSATNWQPLNSPRSLLSNTLVVAEPITNASRFFRLRR